MKLLRQFSIPALGILALTVGTLVTAQTAAQNTPTVNGGTTTAAQQSQYLERGKYLVTIMACADCHSPHDETGKPIKGLEFSGHPEKAPLPEWEPEMLKRNILVSFAPTLTAFAGPFGLSVAGNLTPDDETGIGKLTLSGLKESWETGNHWKFDKRPVMPPMPMANYKILTATDIESIFVYLKSLKPIKNKVPLSKPAKPPVQDEGTSG